MTCGCNDEGVRRAILTKQDGMGPLIKGPELQGGLCVY